MLKLPFNTGLSASEVIIELGDGHCIETAAKKLREHLIKFYLEKSENDSGVNSAIEILSTFLSEKDFKKIRSQDIELNGAFNVKVRIYKTDAGAITFEKL